MASIQAAASLVQQRWIIVMLLQAGVSLMVAWGGLLREDLQPRANVRKGSLVQVWRKGMLCRRIAITV